ncbi:unnamed protein product [Penicillium pancosmium]
MYIFEASEVEETMQGPSNDSYGSLQPTSYWSVSEQRDFPRLLAHFGLDFEGISNFMRTKTTVTSSETSGQPIQSDFVTGSISTTPPADRQGHEPSNQTHSEVPRYRRMTVSS